MRSTRRTAAESTPPPSPSEPLHEPAPRSSTLPLQRYMALLCLIIVRAHHRPELRLPRSQPVSVAARSPSLSLLPA
jgi:hypothetical protein